MTDLANVSTLTPAAPTDLKLGATEQELVADEVRAFAGLQQPGPSRLRYSELADLVESGTIPADRLDQLGTILEIGLQSGRIRRVYGPDGEMAIGKIYQRTPRGAEATTAAASVTRALQAIQGQVVDEIRVTALGPGAYSILLDTRQCQITVRLDRGGVRIDSLSVGM